MTLENGKYTLTPVDRRGLFGEPAIVTEEELLEMVRECLGLLPVK